MELEYDPSYHLNCQLKLRCGPIITLKRLDQNMTYAHLLGGTPDARHNDMMIAEAMHIAQVLCVATAHPHLLHPPRRDYRREPGDMQPVIERRPRQFSGPLYTPEWLPMVRCIARFEGKARVKDPAKCVSNLVVVWFQNQFALPIEEPALHQLLDMDWENLATDAER